jgi:hypothetical protein
MAGSLPGSGGPVAGPLSLTPGTRFGPYEFAGAIGAGGMGEVYRAKDTRLGRDVAVKVLPESLAGDEQRRLRFEREAKAISSLSHPNICALFDVGQEGSTHYLVMELLEGDSLADRLLKGPLPADQVFRYGSQIADALDCAHKHGVIHRDLKPGNVVLTRTGAKLLDFGLARAASGPAAEDRGSGETAAHPLTKEGTIVGTYQYMAPEQLEGQESDARTDIFALGALLYEMATGHAAFTGKSRTSLMAAIVSAQPAPISSITPSCPPALDHIVRKCLEKEPDDRWQSAHDIAEELRWVGQAGSQAGVAASVSGRRRHRETVAWGALALLVGSVAWVRLRPAPAAAAPIVVRSTILLPEKVRLNNAVISPDGRRLVFSGVDAAGTQQLWLRPLDAADATAIPGTEDGTMPFWSPDSQSVAFFADKKLKRVDVSSNGVPIVLLPEFDGIGGAWSAAGEILITQSTGPVYRLAAGAANPQPVTTLDSATHETAHRYPFFLPGGRHFLFLSMNLAGNTRDPANRIWVGSLDGADRKPLVSTFYNPQFANGWLLYVHGGDLGGSLFAQRLDPQRLELVGEAVTVASQISPYTDLLGLADYSVSRDGTLVFDATKTLTRLQWYDRSGKPGVALGEPALHFNPRISPDGTKVAFDQYDSGGQTEQVWVADVGRGVQTRLTSGPSSNSGPVWAPDGTRLAFQTDRNHQGDVYLRSLTGASDSALTDEDGQTFPLDWSTDGRYVTAFAREPAGARRVRIVAIPVAGDHKPLVVVPPERTFPNGGTVSPDVRWLAYSTNETGRNEVYVVSFPDGQVKVQISNAGGSNPRWGQGGREVVYTAPDGTVTAVTIDAAHSLQAGTPRALFRLPEGTGPDWDVSRDGERFLLNVPVTRISAVPLSLVQNSLRTAEK